MHLDPASAVFDAMLEGWATQQRARFLKDNTIGPRLELVRRFAVFTNQYPWQWEPAEAEAFITRSPVAVSTARNYQNTLRLFCGYESDARYGWVSTVWTRVGPLAEEQAVNALRADLDSGRWAARNHAITGLETADLGARILVA